MLWVGAIAGVTCLLASFAAFAFDVKPIIFRSGSMSPSIETGALAFSRTVDAADLRVGDVVTVPSGTGDRITHRIEQVSVVNGQANLILRGDANKIVDDRVYVVESAPRVLLDIPKAGYVVSYATGPVGIFAGGLLVGVVLLTVFRPGTPGPTSQDEPRGRTSAKRGARKAFVLASTIAVGAATVGGAGSVTSTMAYYQDTARATSGTFTGVEAGNSAACSVNASGVVTFRINAVANATGYQLSFGLKPSAMTTIDVGPSGVATIDASLLSAGVYVTSVAAIGVGPGVGASLQLGSFVVVKLLGNTSVSILLCLDINLQLGQNVGAIVAAPLQAPPADSPELSPPAEPESSPEPEVAPSGEPAAPVEEPAPPVEEPPTTEAEATP